MALVCTTAILVIPRSLCARLSECPSLSFLAKSIIHCKKSSGFWYLWFPEASISLRFWIIGPSSSFWICFSCRSRRLLLGSSGPTIGCKNFGTGRRSPIVKKMSLVKSMEAESHSSWRQISSPTNTRAPLRATSRRKTSYGRITTHSSIFSRND